MVIKFYSDPGHGWGVVKRSQLVKYGLTDKITPYSYQRGDSVYLEEDLDLMVFVKAVRASGKEVKFQEYTTDRQSKIRSYNRYTVGV